MRRSENDTPVCFPGVRVLSIDGGIAAALNLRFLRHVEERRPGFMAGVDLFAGTSDGALLAMFLASRCGRDHRDNLRALDDAITYFHEVLGVFQLTPGTALRFAAGRGPAAMAEAQRRVYARHLGDETLGGLAARRRNLLVLALDHGTWKRRTFKSFDLEGPVERERTLVDLALSCSAFPVVLPMHRSDADGRRYFDAAIVVNNPALVAIHEAAGHLRAHGEVDGRDPTTEITLLSLGATEGQAEEGSPGRGRRGVAGRLPPMLDRLGFAGWTQLFARFVYLPDFLIQGSVDTVALQCESLLGPRFRRVRFDFPELDYLASIALPQAWLRRRLDEDAARQFPERSAELSWVDAHWGSEATASTERGTAGAGAFGGKGAEAVGAGRG